MTNMLKFLLVCLGIVLAYMAIEAYIGTKISALEMQHNKDMEEVYNSISRQNDMMRILIKK